MPRNLGVHVVKIPDPRRCQHLVDGSGGDHASLLQHHQSPAQACGKVEVVGRDHDSEPVLPMQRAQERGDAKLISQVEGGGGFVEKEDGGALPADRALP